MMRARTEAMDYSGLHAAWLVAATLHIIAFIALGAWKGPDDNTKRFSIVNIRLGHSGQTLKLKKQETPPPPAPAPDALPAAAPPAPAASAVQPATIPRPAPKPQQRTAPWRRERAKDEPTRRGAPRTLAQYVEQGTSALGAESDDAVTQRYTQVLALWLYKYWQSPESLDITDGMVQAQIRLRITRSGRLIGYRLEQTTGSPILDESVRRMVEKSTPLPEAPKHYPGGTELEFLIPVAITLG